MTYKHGGIVCAIAGFMPVLSNYHILQGISTLFLKWYLDTL